MPIQKTDLFAVDSILCFMQQKAHQNGIDFQFINTCKIKDLTDKIIKETELITLLSDLLENAIIATKDCKKKGILITFKLVDTFYQINVSDTGTEFELETLQNFGIKQHTTHAITGGSGIGLMSIRDIAKRYRATITIKELQNEYYSKTISILFNKKFNIQVLSTRIQQPLIAQLT